MSRATSITQTEVASHVFNATDHFMFLHSLSNWVGLRETAKWLRCKDCRAVMFLLLKYFKNGCHPEPANGAGMQKNYNE